MRYFRGHRVIIVTGHISVLGTNFQPNVYVTCENESCLPAFILQAHKLGAATVKRKKRQVDRRGYGL